LNKNTGKATTSVVEWAFGGSAAQLGAVATCPFPAIGLLLSLGGIALGKKRISKMKAEKVAFS
jgi:hypothetical protein